MAVGTRSIRPRGSRPSSFYHSLGVTGTGDWINYTNPELDKLIDAQAEEFDEQKRQEIVLAAQRIILPADEPQLTLTSGIQYFAPWNYVDFGPQKRGLLAPEAEAECGPFGTEIRKNVPWSRHSESRRLRCSTAATSPVLCRRQDHR